MPDFLAGGGEMGALMRAHDWSGSSLGPPAAWPQPLRTVVRLMLNTGHPMYIWWGADRACLYNDAYRESIGPERHPGSLGRPAAQVWDEIWDVVHPQIEQVMSGGGATWHVDHLVPITRHGRREDVYWTYSYSPIDDESAPAGIGGVLVVCSETTQQILAARQLAAERDQLAQLFEQATTFMALLRGPAHRIEIANPGYLRLVGHRPVLGRTVADALPEAAEQGYLALLDHVYASGQAFAADGARYRLQTTPDGPPVERYVDFVYQPIKDAQGAVTGIFVEGADVTDRAMADAALRESEARFRSALKAGRMGSWETDFQALTRTWSAEGMALFGLTLPDGRGQVGGAHDEYAAALHPDDRHLVKHFHELADRQDSFPAEYRIVKPDGTRLFLLGRGLVVSRGADGRAHRLVSIMADATERKEAEEQLRIERERLGLALAAGRMGAYDMNLQAGILWWSSQTFALFGVDPQVFVPSPQSVIALVHPEDRESFLRRREEAIARHSPFVHELRILRPDGTQVWIDLRGQAEYDAPGRPLRVFGVAMDITERKAAEQLLRDADRQKDRFLAVLAHELRNPLAPIQNAVNVLRQLGSADATATWCHEVIGRQVGQMARLLDDLLDISRLSRGQLRLRPQRLQLAAVIAQAVEIARPLIDAGKHSFAASLPADALELEADLTRLAQVFSNVLINAAKYTPPGGLIRLSVEHRDAHAVVKVADNGIGLDPQHLAQIFDMFGQIESAVDRTQGGQGIGLSLSKVLVEMHGGTIRVASQGVGKGCEFTIRLPIAPSMPLTERQEEQADIEAVPSARHRILVADDLRDGSDSLALLLRAMGHEVEVAYDGEEALRMAQAGRPDVVVLDLGMPKVDGYEACRRIRAAPWGADMVLIAQTGWGQEHDRRQSDAAGFDHHFSKPVDLEALVALISRLP